MFSKITERKMHGVRCFVTVAWLVLIVSLIYDPISPWLTQPDRTFSPFKIDPTVCIKVQGICLEVKPYPLGTTLFWNVVVPLSVFILLIFGHEAWRRMCPLAFLSQIPRALGWQRQVKQISHKAGRTRAEFVKVKPDSWLGRNYLYLQLSWLYIGLCLRLLIINSDRYALAIWLIGTIGMAIAVGYFYGGKSWCNYFCPMAPVQKVFSEPRGLFNSKAHDGNQLITQSMCRTVSPEGKEQSACVACQTPCIDIDSERSYWDGLLKPEQKWLYYGYVGLVVGYFVYHYLYAGNWDYYFSGVWAYAENQSATLLNPGFYLFETPIPIPKLIAVPLMLAVFTAGAYGLGRWVEHRWRVASRSRRRPLSQLMIQHRMFTICTFSAFNIFFIFAGRSLILQLPLIGQFFYGGILVGLSTLWFYRTWQRNSDRYLREGLANRLRKQLHRLDLDLARFIEDRSLEDISPDEVYVLAKVLPGFTHEKRYQAYKGVLLEMLKAGYGKTPENLTLLQEMRSQFAISEDEHHLVLEELGVEMPQLMDPQRSRSREDKTHLTSYRQALEAALTRRRQSDQSAPLDELLFEVSKLSLESHRPSQLNNSPNSKKLLQDLLENEPEVLRSLRKVYSVTVQEAVEVLDELDPAIYLLHRADFLLAQLVDLRSHDRIVNQPALSAHQVALSLLSVALQEQKYHLVTGLLEILVHLHPQTNYSDQFSAAELAQSLHNLAAEILAEIISTSPDHPKQTTLWQQRLHPDILRHLLQPLPPISPADLPDLALPEIVPHLEVLLEHPNPLLQAASLYLMAQIDRSRSTQHARALLALATPVHPLIQAVATILGQTGISTANSLQPFKNLEKLFYLLNSSLFRGDYSETLLELANWTVIKEYEPNELILDRDNVDRELLLLMEGVVKIQRPQRLGERITELWQSRDILDIRKVLSDNGSLGTIVAHTNPTRILVIPLFVMDDCIKRDPALALRCLELEQQHLRWN